MLLFLLPLLVPPITYGIPLATVLYKVGLAGTICGVIARQPVPTVPFVILVMIPFIEQIDPKIEAAARVFGAGTVRAVRRTCWCRCCCPGILAASLLVLVRTIAHVRADLPDRGPDSQTLVVALYYAVFAAGVRAVQSIDAMAVDLHADDAGLAGDRAALRQPDADRDAGEAAAALMGAGGGLELGARAVSGIDIVDGHRDRRRISIDARHDIRRFRRTLSPPCRWRSDPLSW